MTIKLIRSYDIYCHRTSLSCRLNKNTSLAFVEKFSNKCPLYICKVTSYILSNFGLSISMSIIRSLTFDNKKNRKNFTKLILNLLTLSNFFNT